MLAILAILSVVRPAVLWAETPKGITFDDVKFEMEDPKSRKFESSMLTDSIKKLVDQTIRVRGYILPSFKQTGITQFVLVRDNQQCCFGPGAALYDCIIVELAAGDSTEYSVRPVTVVGKFDVHEVRGPDGLHMAIYRLTGGKVE
jgi:hypothetical protein